MNDNDTALSIDCILDFTEGGGFCVLQWSAARSHLAGFGTAAALLRRAGCPRFRRTPDAAEDAERDELP